MAWDGGGEWLWWGAQGARLSQMLILVIQPLRLDQNTWQPRSMGVGGWLAKMGLGERGKHFVWVLKCTKTSSR